MRALHRIIIHCSATSAGMDIGVEEIRQWHLHKGWSDIGYHYVIRRNGRLEIGRPLWRVGAHARGHNRDSIGVCLIGGVDAEDRTKADCNYTSAQWDELHLFISKTVREQRIQAANIVGHRDLPEVTKACPCFDVQAWWDENDP